MKNLEQMIEVVSASMAMEGMSLTQEDKARMRYCAGDRKKTEQVVAGLKCKYSIAARRVHGSKL